jgi:hypothetical protein
MNTVKLRIRGTDRRLAVFACATVLAGCAGPPAASQPTTILTTATTTAATATTTTVAQPRPPLVEPVTRGQLGDTWRPGCPVEPQQLRLVELDHLGLDTLTHRGRIVVHQDLVDEVIAVFDRLYRLGFPIERMQTVDRYPNADDELSMRDNNTSAFNCRDIPGTGSWSYHAYGRAIDVNPRFNPYIDRTGAFQPANAEVYLDRNRIDPGLLKDNAPAVRAFTDHGWQWGGYWRTPKDYQHFEWP